MLVSNNIEIKNGSVVNVSVPSQEQDGKINISVPEQSQTNVVISGVRSLGVTDSRYEHTQEFAGKEWNINHNLNKKPSVTVVDSGDNVVIGEVQYIDNNNLTVSFSASFSGKAYLN